MGYSDANAIDHLTTFSNKWAAIHGESQTAAIEICMEVFTYEYNTEWTEATEELEEWIESNNDELQATISEA